MNPKQRPQAMLRHLRLDRAEKLGLLHHGRLVGRVLGEEIPQGAASLAMILMELGRAFMRFVHDRSNRGPGFVVEAEAIGVLFDQSIRAGGPGGPPKGGRASAAAEMKKLETTTSERRATN